MELTQIPVNEIATPSFARTQNGLDNASIAELAESIQTAGLLQNLVVRSATEDEAPAKYAIVAGRRRLAACKLLGWDSVPCLVKTYDSAESYLDELVENIQREDMTLADTARAVRTFQTVYDDQKKVAALLGKSPAWVSKHLSVTSSRCPDDVKGLLENGKVQDLETLILLRQIAELSPGKHPTQPAVWARLVKIAGDGGMSRALARDALAKLKNPPAVNAETTSGVQRLTTSQTVTIGGKADLPGEPAKSFQIELPIDLLELFERKGGTPALVLLMQRHSESDWLPPSPDDHPT